MHKNEKINYLNITLAYEERLLLMKKFICLVSFIVAVSLLVASCGVKTFDDIVPSEEISDVSDHTEESISSSDIESIEDIVVSFEDSVVSDQDETGEGSEIETFLGGILDNKQEVKFVALGDSIARGFGLSNPRKCSYPAIVSEAVSQKLNGATVNFTNYGIDGLKTSQMLELLDKGYKKLDGADIVTVCIGANNILLPFMMKMAQLVPMNGTDIGGINSSTDTESIGNMFERINSAIASEEFAAEMHAGIDQAAKDLPKIYAKIKERAPNATVLVMTLYSPYHGVEMSLPYIDQKVVFTELSDKYVSELNEVISTSVADAGFILVPCYTPFLESENMLNLGISLVPPRFSIDPHPNLSGHILIANLHISELSNR